MQLLSVVNRSERHKYLEFRIRFYNTMFYTKVKYITV